MKPSTARFRFAAALALFLAWVGALAILAATSSMRPPSRPVSDGPPRDISPSEPATTR